MAETGTASAINPSELRAVSLREMSRESNEY